MAPPRNTDFKAETYERLTTLTKTRFNNIKASVDLLFAQSDPLTVVQLKTLNAYMNEIQKKKDDFEANLQRVLMITGDGALENDTLSADQDEVNNLYIHISSYIEAMLPVEESNIQAGSSEVNSSVACPESQVRLPKFELPKFTGELSSWTSFINLYDTTIHHNRSLSEVMKFQYLLSTLDKEPLNLIRSLNLTADNYTIAYNILRDRYHNNRRLQLLHLNKLLDLPPVSSSQLNSIRSFVSVFTENAQALNALECDIQESNPLLVAVLLRKMDVDLRKKLESFRAMSSAAKHTLPSVREIVDFLNSECTQLEDAIMSQGVQSMKITNKIQSTLKPTFSNKKNVSLIATQVTPLIGPNNPMQCFACNQQSHEIYACPVFKDITPQERFQLVKKYKHCVSCLSNHDIV